LNQNAELKMQEENNEMQTEQLTEDKQYDAQEELPDYIPGCGDSFAEIAD
jgi:hypothetical protein